MIGSFTSWLLIVYVANAQWRIASSYKSRPYLFTSSYPVDCLTHLLNVWQRRSCVAIHTALCITASASCVCVLIKAATRRVSLQYMYCSVPRTDKIDYFYLLRILFVEKKNKEIWPFWSSAVKFPNVFWIKIAIKILLANFSLEKQAYIDRSHY